MKMPGLVKFLQQSLSLPVKRLDSFESLKLAEGVSVPQFSENILSLAVVYGLALQAMGLGTINSNLLPREIARQDQWKKKKLWVAASVAVCMAGSFLSVFAAKANQADFESAQTKRSLSTMDSATRKENSTQSSLPLKKKTKNESIFTNPEIWSRCSLMPSNNASQEYTTPPMKNPNNFASTRPCNRAIAMPSWNSLAANANKSF